jgi:aldose 1-epimerase
MVMVAGFPSDLDVYVTYQLSSPYDLRICMNATALNKATPVNHAYWNLGGHASGDVLGHLIQVHASRYTIVDKSMVPTGEIAGVADTPYDLRQLTPVGSPINLVTGGGAVGYDVNYEVHGDGFRQVAYVRDPESGRAMEVWADQPGVQLYTSNWMKDEKGKTGAVYQQYAALCLETQGFPDAVNHSNFPSVIIRHGGIYKHDMLLKFSHWLIYFQTCCNNKAGRQHTKMLQDAPV